MSKQNFPYVFEGDKTGLWADYNEQPCKMVRGGSTPGCRLIEFPNGQRLYVVPEAIRCKKSGKLDLLGLRKIAANVTAVGYLKTDLST